MPSFLPCSSFYRRVWAGGAYFPVGNRRPPPPIQEDRDPALVIFRTTHLHYLPHSMHAAYIASDKDVVGRVNWQLPACALKSLTGHYKDDPTKIGVRDMRENLELVVIQVKREAKEVPRSGLPFVLPPVH